MLRVLHIMGCSDAGGISSVVRSFYEFIDRSEFHFDIALTVPEQGQNSRALEKLGAKIFFIPMKAEDREGFCKALTNLLTEGHYDAVHVHESETCYVALRIATQLGIPCRIAHAHTTSPYEGVRGVIRRWSGCLLNYVYATHVIGCGQKAGERVFGKLNMKRPRAVVLPNGVDTERFSYRPALRAQVRQELQAENTFLLGMVCRLSEEKNISFAIDLMAEVLERIPNAMLMIVGNGPEQEALEQKIRERKLENSVCLLGRREDVDRLYQAFDLVLMPSFHEGFPVVAVEAMAAGLPVLLSDTITRELSFGSGVRYLPLDKMEAWVEAVSSFRQDENREKRQADVKKQGLDIRQTVKKLEQIYRQDVSGT